MSEAQKSSGISRDAWLKALEEAGIPESDEHDPESITVKEFMEMFGIAQTTAKYRLNILVRQGKATETKKRVTNDYGRTNVLKSYRLT